MSCDWDVYCLDCKKEHGFDDANHDDKLMRELSKIGPQLKKLCELMAPLVALRKPPLNLYVNPSIVLNSNSDSHAHPLIASWWIEHGDHRLIARDEYGRCDDECDFYFRCGECGSSKCCKRAKGHTGEHKDKRDDA